MTKALKTTVLTMDDAVDAEIEEFHGICAMMPDHDQSIARLVERDMMNIFGRYVLRLQAENALLRRSLEMVIRQTTTDTEKG